MVSAPQLPDYIRIADPNGVNPVTVMIPNQTTDPANGQDGNTYNTQLYSCEPALGQAPAAVTFSACYNDGRVVGLTDSFRWYVTPASAGAIGASTGVMSWTGGFFGDATIGVAAVGCDGTETASRSY